MVASGLPPLSFAVTVMVEVVAPSTGTVVGEAVTVDWAAAAGGTAVKFTVAVCVTTTVSVGSVAVKTGDPGVVDVTVKVTTPVGPVGPEAAEIVSVAPRLEARATVLPRAGELPASNNVTVTVEVLMPSAVTEVGAAATVDLAALAGGVTAVLLVTVRMPVVAANQVVLT